MQLTSKYKSYNFKIKSYHTDLNGDLTIPSLFLFLQEVAWDHAHENDFGYEFLLTDNSFWVLSRVYLELNRLPRWKDEIVIKTWPKTQDGFFALRDFEVSLKDTVIASLTSYWLVLDQESRRPKRLENYPFFHADFYDRHAVDRRLKKIELPDKMVEIMKMPVVYSDLDVNQHVNNATYIRWIFDAIFRETEDKKQISSFEIHYLLECSFGEEIIVETDESDNQYQTLRVNRKSDNKEVVRARIEWK